MDKLLKKYAFNKYRDNALNCWVLGVSMAFFLAAVTLLGLVMGVFNLLVIAVLGLPFIFACYLSYISSSKGEQITFSNHFRRYVSFYNVENVTSFRFFISLLYALGVYIVSEVSISIVLVIFLKVTNPTAFDDIINTFMSLFSDAELASKSYEEIFGENYKYILYYQTISVSPSVILGVMFFIYKISTYSINIFARGIFFKFAPAFRKYNYSYFFKKHHKEFTKDYFSLNWPMYVIFLISSVTFLVLGLLFISKDAVVITTTSIAVGFGCLMFFFPFYFANMSAIYEKYEDDFKIGVVETSQILYSNLQNKMSMNEEERKKMEELLERLKNQAEQTSENKEDDNN